jgi:hypothetical protein
MKKNGSDIHSSIVALIKKQHKKTLVLWATDCAEHVLPYFQEKYPEDNRPQKAIEAGRAWVHGKITVSEARTAAFAAHAAARSTDQSDACAAARSAGHAAATVHVTSHAIHAADYAAKAARDKIKERNWQEKRLLYLQKNS